MREDQKIAAQRQIAQTFGSMRNINFYINIDENWKQALVCDRFYTDRPPQFINHGGITLSLAHTHMWFIHKKLNLAKACLCVRFP